MHAARQIPGNLHPYIGQEAVAAGACACLRPDDYIVSTHRGHGHVLAKGGTMKRLLAELLGKGTGYNKGKGGTLHVQSIDSGDAGDHQPGRRRSCPWGWAGDSPRRSRGRTR